MKTEHTAPLWYESKSAGGHQGLVADENTGRTVAVVYDKADTAFIVRACNVHDDLVAALEAMLGDNLPPAGEAGHIDYGRAIVMARAALAKAKG